jgi:hypothetical protein
MKRICKYGHDTFICGRDKSGHCKSCIHDSFERTYIKRKRKLQQYCKYGHDTFECGRDLHGYCLICKKESRFLDSLKKNTEFKCIIKNCNNFGELLTKPSLCKRHESQEWRSDNREYANELQMKYYYRDREKMLKKNKTPEVRAYKLRWQHENKVRRKVQNKIIRDKAVRSLNGRYNSLKRAAKAQNFPLDITKEQHGILLSKRCYYCSGPLGVTGSGLDRVNNDPNIGYILSNVVPCCPNCNRLKCHLLTSSETLKLVMLLKKLRKGQNVWPNVT